MPSGSSFRRFSTLAALAYPNSLKIFYTFQLIEFNDTTKTGRLQDQNLNDTRVYDLIHFNWTRNLVNIDDKRVAIRLIGQNFTLDNTSLHGTINLTVIQKIVQHPSICQINKISNYYMLQQKNVKTIRFGILERKHV